jgi:uncharacterized protein (TIGR02217 family)
MIIDNVRLPIDVERGAKGGPLFSTTINVADGGAVSANQNWSYPLYVGNISYGIQTKENLLDVIDFFWARRGRLRGFLFRDWADYEMVNEPLGTGDGVEQNFQCIRRYADTVLPFDRPLKYPIESTMTVYLDGTPVSDSAWSLLSTGEVRFTTAPTVGQVVTASGEFNIACRFMQDQLEIQMEVWNVGAIPSISIMEVRE